MKRTALGLSLLVALCSEPAFARQSKGDREIGLGGQFFYTHNATAGSLAIEASFGYFLTARDYIGVEVEPNLVFTKLNGVRSTQGEIFVKGSYRRLFGDRKGRVFPFVGGGAGVEELGEVIGFGGATAAGFATNALVFGEVG